MLIEGLGSALTHPPFALLTEANAVAQLKLSISTPKGVMVLHHAYRERIKFASDQNPEGWWIKLSQLLFWGKLGDELSHFGSLTRKIAVQDQWRFRDTHHLGPISVACRKPELNQGYCILFNFQSIRGSSMRHRVVAIGPLTARRITGTASSRLAPEASLPHKPHAMTFGEHAVNIDGKY